MKVKKVKFIYDTKDVVVFFDGSSVKYDNVPDELQNMFFKKYDNYYTGFEKNDIKFSSSNKQDCEIFLQSNKYNL